MRSLEPVVTGTVERMRRIAETKTVSRSCRVQGVLKGRGRVSVLAVAGCLAACFAAAGGAAASVSPRPAPVARFPGAHGEAGRFAEPGPARLGRPGISLSGHLGHRGRS